MSDLQMDTNLIQIIQKPTIGLSPTVKYASGCQICGKEKEYAILHDDYNIHGGFCSVCIRESLWASMGCGDLSCTKLILSAVSLILN